mmetsp:Transcript_42488/g.134969  ORF Transcript_42488/g.134969 Transcript_42488/m.134969 type:complete len:101 (+) Transcript_42488:438-740(+)
MGRASAGGTAGLVWPGRPSLAWPSAAGIWGVLFREDLRDEEGRRSQDGGMVRQPELFTLIGEGLLTVGLPGLATRRGEQGEQGERGERGERPRTAAWWSS